MRIGILPELSGLSGGVYQYSIRLWTDRGMCDDLVRRGRERLARYTPDDYRRRLAEIMEEAKERVLSERLKME